MVARLSLLKKFTTLPDRSVFANRNKELKNFIVCDIYLSLFFPCILRFIFDIREKNDESEFQLPVI